MNFRFTNVKALGSLIIGLISGIYVALDIDCVGTCALQIQLVDKVIGLVIGFIVAFALTYVIWSIFQKE